MSRRKTPITTKKRERIIKLCLAILGVLLVLQFVVVGVVFLIRKL